jgi:hypothetical protein
MQIFFISLITLFFNFPQQSPTLQPRNICEVFGTTFEEKNVFAATYRVYLEEDEYSADLVVFKETNELMADKAGLWFFTRNKAFAEFTFCYVEDRNMADFTIYFTDIDVEARCNR